MNIEYAISIRQPWVELILRGEKIKEFRSRATKIRGHVYLYASKTVSDAPGAWRRLAVAPGELRSGLILGSVQIVGCTWDTRAGKYAYKLHAPRRFRTPLEPTNHPGQWFWRPEF